MKTLAQFLDNSTTPNKGKAKPSTKAAKPKTKPKQPKKSTKFKGSVVDKLWQHNKNALNYLKTNLSTTEPNKDKAIIVQPTGSGKSGVMFGFIESIFEKARTILVIQPTLSIEVDHKQSSMWNPAWESKVRYVTYSKISTLPTLTEKQLEDQGFTQVDVVFLDEVHHIAAPIWSKGYKKLTELNPSMFVIGLTATPIRYLDDGLNVATDYFNDNIYESVTLIEAIRTGMFAKPNYVTSYLDKDQILAELNERIMSFPCSDDYRQILKASYTELENAWNNQPSLEEKIKAYIDYYLPEDTDSNLKFVVFSSSVAELEKNKELVKGWFKSQKIRKTIKTYEVHTKAKTKDEEVFAAFERKRSNTVDLLFAIDKLNEGVHFKNLSGLIMLRDTTSPTVYYQQLGRAFFAGMKKQPLVFDFVNNHHAMGVVRNILIDENDPHGEIPQSLIDANLSSKIVNYSTVMMHDEMMDLAPVFSKLTTTLHKDNSIWFSNTDEAWEACLAEVKALIAQEKRLPQATDDYVLYTWFRQQVALWLFNELEPWQVTELKATGIKLRGTE